MVGVTKKSFDMVGELKRNEYNKKNAGGGVIGYSNSVEWGVKWNIIKRWILKCILYSDLHLKF